MLANVCTKKNFFSHHMYVKTLVRTKYKIDMCTVQLKHFRKNLYHLIYLPRKKHLPDENFVLSSMHIVVCHIYWHIFITNSSDNSMSYCTLKCIHTTKWWQFRLNCTTNIPKEFRIFFSVNAINIAKNKPQAKHSFLFENRQQSSSDIRNWFYSKWKSWKGKR